MTITAVSIRDPAKCASDLSMMAQKVRAILKEIDNG